MTQPLTADTRNRQRPGGQDMRQPPTIPACIHWNDWLHHQNIGRKAQTQDVHHNNKLSLGTEVPSGNDWGSPAWLHKLQLNIKTIQESMVQETNKSFFGKYSDVHSASCTSSFILHLTLLTLLWSRGSQVIHWGGVSILHLLHSFIFTTFSFEGECWTYYFKLHSCDSDLRAYWLVTTFVDWFVVLYMLVQARNLLTELYVVPLQVISNFSLNINNKVAKNYCTSNSS